MFTKILGVLLVSTTVFALGPVTGGISKFGVNSDIDTASVPEDIWSSGAYTFPSAAAATTIVSTDAADLGTSSGARTVHIQGLNSSYANVEEDVTMSGTGAVTLTNQLLRLNAMRVLTAGSVGTNSGAIQLKHGSTIIGEIPSGYGEAPMAIFTTRKQSRLKGWSVSIYGLGTASVGTFKLQIKENGGAWRTVAEMGANTVGNSNPSQEFDKPIPVPPQTDIRIRVASMSADNTAVSGKFDLEEEIF